MICADTSSLVALLDGELGGDVDLVRQALRDRLLCISPISVTELLSDPDPIPSLEELVVKIPQLESIRDTGSVQESSGQKCCAAKSGRNLRTP